jgi:Abnormal spindle-like microcephaly-assoc'd, ASPM-SPD-2-Hydin
MAWLGWIIAAAWVWGSLAGATAQENAAPPNRPAASSGLVKLTPASLDFGDQAVGSIAPPKTATLANAGSTTLKITDIVTSGIDFSQSNDCGQNLMPGAACTIQITFRPAITGPRLATLQILDSDPSSPQSVVLNGAGR